MKNDKLKKICIGIITYCVCIAISFATGYWYSNSRIKRGSNEAVAELEARINELTNTARELEETNSRIRSTNQRIADTNSEFTRELLKLDANLSGAEDINRRAIDQFRELGITVDEADESSRRIAEYLRQLESIYNISGKGD